MWVATGPFDGEIGSDLNFQKDKLLKTHSSYPVGRKDRPLSVGSKKVSHDHCEFIVGTYSTDDVLDPSSKPTLQFINKKNKGMKIMRGSTEVTVNPGATQELEHGDVVSIIVGLPITVKWIPVCCFCPRSPVSVDICASLAINLIHTPNSQTTHHLTNNYAATPLIAASLISACQFVKPEWLHEVIRLGNLPRNSDPANGTSLEDTFVLPQTSKFRPAFSPSLPPSQKVFKAWEPNEERLAIFKSYRFLYACENMRGVDGDLRAMIALGEGSLEAFDVHGGVSKLHKALSRGQAKEGKKLILIGNPQAMQAAIGVSNWEELIAEAKSFNMQFVLPETIVQAVVDIDTSVFQQASILEPDMNVDESHQSMSPLPDFVPNTHPDELSIVPTAPGALAAPARKLTRRVASRQPSQEPPLPEPDSQQEIEAPRPRRALTRRVNAGKPVVTGLDDPPAFLNATPDLSDSPKPPPRPIVDLTAPTPARTTRLKRRIVGVVDAQGSLETQGLAMSIDESEEPPNKKFKALFDSTDPDNGGTPLVESPQDMQSDPFGRSLTRTETQTGTQARTGRRLGSVASATSLGLLREEEEETQSLVNSTTTTNQRGQKRALASVDDDEMQGQQSVGTSSGPGPLATKKRAVENVNAVQRTSAVQVATSIGNLGGKPTSSAAKHGAPTGKPDTDVAFLKAIASTKKGKKTEDQFDREFNKLKISKPDLEREGQEEEWTVLADFGDDTGVRGNFMVVLDMDVYAKSGDGRRNANILPQWQGKPNFKKFKKKIPTGVRSNKVELVISKENDYGMGVSYWKGGDAQSQDETKGFPTSRRQSQSSQIQKSYPKTQGMIANDSDSDEAEAPRRGRSKPPSRAKTAVPKHASTHGKPAAKSKPLFLDSDDDIQEDEEAQTTLDLAAGDDDQTIRSSVGTKTSAPRRTSRKTSKPTPIIVDDDSDDDAVFKGFKGKK